MSINYTPRTWVAGEVVTAAFMNTEIRDALTGIQAAWTAYTPTATNFTVGNGTLLGRWQRLGKTAVGIRINFTAGSTSSYTASQAQVSLPAAAHATGAQFMPMRFASSGGLILDGFADIAAGASVAGLIVTASGAAANMGAVSTGVQTPGTTGLFIIEGTYELA